ncbi:Cyclin-dependent kinase A-1 [Colletotrichum spinosum]|uniref:Cyclin-dependent kinase A-1 n=1 Tax=Colletotrichum spinosum TaxID=1347390 RepID=A0A4R8QAA3_9PEZI|nr:Cyclin-dependent kinase A-1 [Colletotrichum spinosum]
MPSAVKRSSEPMSPVQGLIKEPEKLILDDKTRVRKVHDRGDSYRPPKRKHSDQKSTSNKAVSGEDNLDVEDLIDRIATELDEVRVSYLLEPEKLFVPHSKFSRIFTFNRVRKLILSLPCMRKEKNKEGLAREIYYGRADGKKGPAVKLLAVLVGIGKVGDFAKHFSDGIRDSCLPLKKDAADEKRFNLHCRTHGVHQSIKQYGRPSTREEFSRWSYTLSAPYIKWEPSRHCHYVLDTGDVFPMDIKDKVKAEGDSDKTATESRSDADNTYGGFSEVYKVKIHEGHWDFGDHGIRHPQGFFALKKLTSHNRLSFNLELSSLLFTGQQYKKQHLIQLLATFEVVNNAAGGMSTFYFLFDWAEGSLTKFWQNNQQLVRDKRHCHWMATQFYEICEALQCVHNDRMPTLKYIEDRASNHSLYGRHGDIKPGNFLWFRTASSHAGLLALSDFGLGRLHTQVSRSKQDPRNLERSASYRCPEFDLPSGQVSPRSDIFSLGCVFLEYVTWFFHGYNVIDQDFPNARLENDIYGFESDTFFSIRNQQAYIKPAVLSWIEQLQRHPDCSWYLMDLLDVIKTKIY